MMERPRTSPIMMPMLDAVSGRSYGQSNQTAGALGGRRNKEEWFVGDSVSAPNRKIVKTAGGTWRLVRASARVRVAPTTGSVSVDILAQIPGAPSPVSIFSTPLTIAPGQTEAVGGIIKTSSRLLPVGTLVSMDNSNVGLADVLMAAAAHTSSIKYSSLVGGSWSSPVVIPDVSPSTRPMIFPLNSQLWFAIGTSTIRGSGIAAERTKDGGDIWTVAPSLANGEIFTVALDAGGRLWCANRVNGGMEYSEVYYSDTDGDTWILSRTINTALVDDTWKVLPHPSDEDIIAVITSMISPASGAIDYTLNRGSSWNRNTDTDLYIGNSPPLQNDAALLSNNRLVVIGYLPNAVGGRGAAISDNWGASWTAVFTASGSNPRIGKLFVSPDGTRLGFLYVEDDTATPGIWHLVLSTNGATSFAETSLATELHDIWSGAAGIVAGIPHTMGLVDDALYVLIDNAGGSQGVFKLAPVSSLGLWTDLTGALTNYLYSEASLVGMPAGAVTGGEDLTLELHYRVRAVGQ